MDVMVSALTRLAFATLGMAGSPRLSILIFHRVHQRADPLFPDEPDAVYFERLMRLVARSFRVMTLGQAVSRLARGELPSRALVVTFDDGYADNALVALPILQRCGLAASFFVSTGFLDGGRMWNDSVIECVRACAAPEIDLEEFGLGRRALPTHEARRAVIDVLLPRIKYLSLAGREDAIQRLQTLSGVVALPRSLMMTSEQVRQMHRTGMEIGAHTVRHPILTSLSIDAAQREIADGKHRLESIIDAPVDVFAYPNGKPHQDYAAPHVALVQRLGFRAAVSTAPGVAQTGDGLFQLPRFTPWARSTPTWAAQLALNQRNTAFERVVSDAGA